MSFSEMKSMDSKYDLLQKIDKNYFREENQNLPACGTCGLGGTRYGSIGSTGNVYSCQEMTENDDCNDFIIGNIYDEISDNKRIEITSKFNVKNVKCEKKDRCEKCSLNRICKGGCTINNYFKNGKLDVASEPWCRYQEILFKAYKNMEVFN